MINNTQQQNTNNLGILANFTRSFDNYNNENDNTDDSLHLTLDESSILI